MSFKIEFDDPDSMESYTPIDLGSLEQKILSKDDCCEEFFTRIGPSVHAIEEEEDIATIASSPSESGSSSNWINNFLGNIKTR